MLVLSRKVNEAVCIGDNVRVWVQGINANGTVRLGIEAPREIRVDRDEVRQKRLAAEKAGLGLPQE